MINNSKRLKYICSPTTGLNHIKVSNSNVKIISLKGEYSFLETIRATPEHIFGLTISLLRNYSHAFLSKENNMFTRAPYKGYELYQNKVGIIGLGRVGRIIANYFSAFESDVYYYDLIEVEHETAIACKSIDEVIEKSNIIILCANYTLENEKMINSFHFHNMQGKYFINAARGELVDEKSLLDYLKKNWFKGVAIDVISDETQESDFLNEAIDLSKKYNIIITPHIGGATFSSMMRTEDFIAEKLIRYIDGRN